MKNHILIFSMVLFSSSLFAQWDVFPSHVAFRTTNVGFDEWTHYTPFDISFWTNTNYNVGVTLNPTNIRFFNLFTEGQMTENSLAFTDFFGDRVRMDYNGLNYTNGASWTAFNAHVYGNAGQLDLYNGANGNYIARLGSTSMNSDQGSLSLFANMGQKAVDIAATSTAIGYINTYGSNGSLNSYVGSTSSNYGYVYVADQNGTVQAYMYSNVGDGGNGYVVADTKNFKVPHPKKADSDIWYACIEGPEAGAYDRGTTQLVNGEAFIPYSSHYSLISNPNTTTVQLTPHHWDTFGLAVIEKTDKGFLVKELKGGKGNFSFDWEVKSVRRGKENYQVVRPKDYIPSVISSNVQENPNDPYRKKAVKKANTVQQRHKHSPYCIHSKR